MSDPVFAAEESDTPPHEITDSLLFFDGSLRARLDEPSGDAPVSDEERSRRIATELLTAGAMTRWPGPLDALRSPRQRIARAAFLIAETQNGEETRSTGVDEMWAVLDTEWHWVARAEPARLLLIERARELGSTNPKSVADAVRTAIVGELVPLLHLQSLMLAPANDSARLARHRAFLDRWALPATASSGLVVAYGWYVLLLVRDGREPTPAMDAALAGLMRARGSDDPVAAATLSYYVRLNTDRVSNQLESGAPVRWFKRRLAALEAVGEAGGDTIAVFEAISAFAVALGLRQIAQNHSMADGIFHFAKAIVHDPSNAVARDQFHHAGIALDRFRKKAATLQSRGAAISADRATMIAQLEKGVARSNAFMESDEAKATVARFEKAARHGMAWRLDVPVNDVVRREQLAELARVIDQFGAWAATRGDAGAVAGFHYVSFVQKVAFKRQPELRSLPWDKITAVLERGILPNADSLGLLLPEPDLPEVAAIISSVRAAARPIVIPPDRPRLDWLGAWFLSRRNPVFKLTVATGFAVLAYAVGIHARQLLNEGHDHHPRTTAFAGSTVTLESAR